VVIFRLGFARSIFEARTLIKEKQVKLNDKLVNPAAYNQLIKLGSKISIEPSNKTYLAKIKHLKLN
jgi:ribosomal protein S4